MLSLKLWKRYNSLKMGFYNVIAVYQSPTGILRGYMFSKNMKMIHVTRITDKTFHCTCLGSQGGNRECYHVRATAFYAVMKNLKKIKIKKEKLMYIKTGIPELDEYVGGIPVSSLSQIFGGHEVGKTTLALQILWNYIKQMKRNVLYLYNEGGQSDFLENWLLVYNTKYDTKINLNKVSYVIKKIKQKDGTLKAINVKDPEYESGVKKTDTLYTLHLPNIMDILAIHGKPVRFEFSEKGMLTVKPLQAFGLAVMDPADSPLGRLIRECNIGMLIYDSVTGPIGSKNFPHATEVYPARHSVTSMFLGHAEDLSEILGLTVLGISHERGTSPMARERQDSKEPKGPSIQGYTFKNVIYLKKLTKGRLTDLIREKIILEKTDTPKNYRELFLERWTTKEPWSKSIILRFSDNGLDGVVQPKKVVSTKKVGLK